MDYLHQEIKGKWADLHVHTTASDGSMSPKELVRQAKAIGLGAIAITDHDTTDGVQEALEEGQSMGLLVIPAVEVSVNLDDGRSFHLLGYGIEVQNSPISELLKRTKDNRRKRNELILDKLQDLGVRIMDEDLIQMHPTAQIGRPHIALALVRKGYVSSIEEAFKRYLGYGAPAYAPKQRCSYKEAIDAIIASGGVPVMAHPHKWIYRSRGELEEVLENLADYGLMGTEVACPDMESGFREFLLKTSARLNLIPTGGTDFHGITKPEIKLGFGKGTLRVPVQWVTGLLNAIKHVRRKLRPKDL